MIDLKVALDKLDGLTSTEIADEMRFLGIKGRKGCPETCVIAAYITAMTGIPPARLGVSMVSAMVFDQDDACTEAATLSLPRSVQRFINNFDNGSYSDLVEEE